MNKTQEEYLTEVRKELKEALRPYIGQPNTVELRYRLAEAVKEVMPKGCTCETKTTSKLDGLGWFRKRILKWFFRDIYDMCSEVTIIADIDAVLRTPSIPIKLDLGHNPALSQSIQGVEKPGLVVNAEGPLLRVTYRDLETTYDQRNDNFAAQVSNRLTAIMRGKEDLEWIDCEHRMPPNVYAYLVMIRFIEDGFVTVSDGGTVHDAWLPGKNPVMQWAEIPEGDENNEYS